ncbi:MAG TPA: AMIN domain-containing protein, partial [Acidobacteriaceae bacterium]
MSNPMPARLLSSSACRRGVIPAVAAAALALLCVAALAAPRHSAHARRTTRTSQTPFARAEQLRDELESRPESSRTLNEYGRVLDAYRTVYHVNPADPKAPEAVNMVAGLLAEQGRVFHQDKTSLSAVGQFEFLRAQYPTSPYRAPALLAEATIYLHDLHDPVAAKAAYLKFLNSYPRHPLAAQAHAGLKEIDHQKRRKEAAEAAPDDVAETSSEEPPPPVRVFKPQSTEITPTQIPNSRITPAPSGTTTTPHRNGLTRSDSAPSATANPRAIPPAATAQTVGPAMDSAEGQPVLTGAIRVAAQEHHGQLPLVTNVRHWSTPVYTRVAIDLQDQVQYEAARVPNPDRIYFDLHGARVAPELLGRTVNVTDDGFLQRIRVAQFSNDVTRIVLDVNQVSEYSAFFLPNPWRL